MVEQAHEWDKPYRSFTAWLTKCEHRGDPIGELARNFALPEFRHLASYVEYLHQLKASSSSVETLRSAWAEYVKELSVELLSRTDDAKLIGTTIGEWKIIGLLGTGQASHRRETEYSRRKGTKGYLRKYRYFRVQHTCGLICRSELAELKKRLLVRLCPGCSGKVASFHRPPGFSQQSYLEGKERKRVADGRSDALSDKPPEHPDIGYLSGYCEALIESGR